ncbi:MAG: DUF4906 domain-containing protein [Bacteroidales bacterium]|nr:DUF4906 domain-containing protein [Bacteroidales bacterium]
MKKNIFLNVLGRWALLLGLGMAAAGCQPDPAGGGAAGFLRPERTMPVAVTVMPPDDPTLTKSAFTGSDDVVNNYSLLVFDEGVLAAKYYHAGNGDLVLSVPAGRPRDYFCVANLGDVTGAFTVGVSREADLAGWLLPAPVAGAAGLPMSWQDCGLVFSRAQLLAGAHLPVCLKRLVAQYDIVIDRSGLERYSFTPTSLSLCGPAAVSPFADSRSRADAVRTDYAVAADLAALAAGRAAHFFPLENRWGELLPGNTDPWAKVPGNLPSNARPSYIELAGQAATTDGSGLSFPVKYRFYLGANAVSDFDVIRNRVYTVTLLLSDAVIERTEPSWKIETGSYVEYSLDVTPRAAEIACDGSCWFTAELVTLVNGREAGREDVSFECAWSVDADLAAVTTTSMHFRVEGNNTTERAVSGYVCAYFRHEGVQYEASAKLTVLAPFRPYLEASVDFMRWDYDEYGGAVGRGITVSSNVAWQAELVEGTGDYQLTSSSGSGNGSFMVYPIAENETVESVTGRIRIYNATYDLECLVDLEQLPFYRRKDIEPVYYRVTVEPEEADISADGRQTYTATLHLYRDAACTDCFYREVRLATILADWTSSNPSAAVMHKNVAQGVNTRHGNSYLETTITVSPWWHGAGSADALLRVADIPVETIYRLDVSVTPMAIACDGTAQAQAWLQESNDGGESWSNVRDVTSAVNWESSDPSVATIASDGTVTGCNSSENAATVRITGTYAGVSPSVSDYADLEVAGADPGPGPGPGPGPDPGPDPDPVLTELTFDQSHYTLVWVADGQVHTARPFTLTAHYDNGTTVDVTAEADYADMGCLSLDAAAGLLEATAACSDKTLTASYGNLTTTALYSAEDLEVPVGLTGLHLESQDNTALEFIIDALDVELQKVLTGDTRILDVTADLVLETTGPIVSDGYRPDRGWLLHFTSSATPGTDPVAGTITFRYTRDGLTAQRQITVLCDANRHITWRD